MVSGEDRRIGLTRDLLSSDLLTSKYGIEIVTADVATASAVRRLTDSDFGPGVA